MRTDHVFGQPVDQRCVELDALGVIGWNVEHPAHGESDLLAASGEATKRDVTELQQVAVGDLQAGGERLSRELSGIDQNLADLQALGCARANRGTCVARCRRWPLQSERSGILARFEKSHQLISIADTSLGVALRRTTTTTSLTLLNSHQSRRPSAHRCARPWHLDLPCERTGWGRARSRPARFLRAAQAAPLHSHP